MTTMAERNEPIEIDRILSELSALDAIPVAAIQAARDRREALAPVFIGEIEAFKPAPIYDDEETARLFLIFHLLGEWRETAAYRPLCRFLQWDPEALAAVLGDAAVATSPSVIAAVFDGDPGPLYETILNSAANEFVRVGMFECLVNLVRLDRLDRDEAVRFLEACPEQLEERPETAIWGAWATAVAELGEVDLRPLVERIFEQGFVDSMLMDFDDFQEDLLRRLENPATAERRPGESELIFSDTIEQLPGWYPLTGEPFYDGNFGLDPLWDYKVSRAPLENPYKDVGRNDPCPCGSGKKFKKCCLTSL